MGPIVSANSLILYLNSKGSIIAPRVSKILIASSVADLTSGLTLIDPRSTDQPIFLPLIPLSISLKKSGGAV